MEIVSNGRGESEENQRKTLTLEGSSFVEAEEKRDLSTVKYDSSCEDHPRLCTEMEDVSSVHLV